MSKVKIAVGEIKQFIGKEIGPARWLEIPQSRANKFAEVTGDFQWTHMDEERAKTNLPGGRTIVHNFLLVSIIPQLFDELVKITGLKYGLNRGTERINFIKPLLTGDQVRIRVKVAKLEYLDHAGMTATFSILIESRDTRKAVLTMELQLLLVTG